MKDLLEISARVLDEGASGGVAVVAEPNAHLWEIAADIALIQSFSHVVTFKTGDGLVVFDTSLEAYGGEALRSLRRWTSEPVTHICYTHGHVDHVGGAKAFVCEACETARVRPKVIGHENVTPRFDRYEFTNGYNFAANARQFAPAARFTLNNQGVGRPPQQRFGPTEFVPPDTTFRDRMGFRAGDLHFDLHHAKGETDDHLWAWIPERKAICSGDFVGWVFPNAGNPQKVQRYPLEWARALRDMAALEPELLLPAHGLPIGGRDRIAEVLDSIASALEHLVGQAIAMMNDGARLDDLIHGIHLPRNLTDKPYLRPIYDEPEFVLHNVWRLYGGWYDGNPASLKPAPERALAAEVAALAGGAASLAAHAEKLALRGDLRLAGHFAEMATLAEPSSRKAHEVRAAVFTQRREIDTSLMAKGIFDAAAAESSKHCDALTASSSDR